MKLSKRRKALMLAAAGSVVVILLLLFLTWLLRFVVVNLGLELSENNKQEIIVKDNVATSGVIDGVSVGLQTIDRSEPYRLHVVTYVAKGSGSLAKRFNGNVQEFLNVQKDDFENLVQNLPPKQKQESVLMVESQSVRSEQSGLIFIDYKIEHILPTFEKSDTLYITVEVSK